MSTSSREAASSASKCAGILDGIRVLDFSHQMAGPFCTAIMGDMGADVLKIEAPGRGDAIRYEGDSDPRIGTPYFWGSNRNKRSVTLNLKSEKGRGIALELARMCDVAVENFRPGVMDGLGLSYRDLEAAKPDIIYLSLSAFGPTGPLRDRPGMDLVLQAISGIMGTTGESNDRTPVKAGPPIIDVSSGIYGALAVALALYHRERTGEGQHIQMAMLDCAMTLQTNLVGALLVGQGLEVRFGSAHPKMSPYQAYRGSDGRYFVVACVTNTIWRRACAASGLEELAHDERFSTMKGRVEYREELNAALEPVLATRPASEWVEIFSQNVVPSVLVNMPSEALQLEQLAVNGMIEELDHPTLGRHKALGTPLRVTPPGGLHRHSPILGEHTDEVLAWLGKDESEIESLRAEGVV